MQEVIRWIEEGKTYNWIVAEYQRKYNIETSQSMWASFRSRRGLKPRIARDPELIPWKVKEEHQFRYDLAMLRLEARKRQGYELRDEDQKRHTSWRTWIDENNAVVYYDPDTEEGFFCIPREEGDTDIIRAPKKP
ncbi:hypothetical protein [Streptomyces luteireticuli]|uniref:hypothetical protein n=1 Tax=Streptomyces luteireticuli TaxID=173858 RepID=UPI003557F14D